MNEVMGRPVPIVRFLSDGRYQLNEEELTSIVSAADGCQRVAVISIIGSEGLEKGFVLKCLANYLNSENKDEWPDITQTVNNCGSVEDTEDRSLVYLWSKPFILRDDDQNTAVFLMDANHDFRAQNENSNTSLTDDIIDMFCGTSSTIIYLNRGQFNVYELTAFKELIEKAFNRSFNTELFEELIYLVIDWNTNKPENKDKNYLFGAKGGDQYMKEFSFNLDHFFNQTMCYLLPSIGADLNDKDLVFDKIDKTFVNELLKLIKNKLLNIDEINVKKGEDSQCIEPNGLIALFRHSVQQMNDRKTCETNGEELNESFERRNSLRQSLSNRSSESDIEVLYTEDTNSSSLYSEDGQESGQSSDVAKDVMQNFLKEEQSIKQWSEESVAANHEINSNNRYNNQIKQFSTEFTDERMDRTTDTGVNQEDGQQIIEECVDVTNGEANGSTEREEQSLKEWSPGDEQNTTPDLTHNSNKIKDFDTDWKSLLKSSPELNITENEDFLENNLNGYQSEDSDQSNQSTDTRFITRGDGVLNVERVEAIKSQIIQKDLISFLSDGIPNDFESFYSNFKSLSIPEKVDNNTDEESDPDTDRMVSDNQHYDEVKHISDELTDQRMDRTVDTEVNQLNGHQINEESVEITIDSNEKEQEYKDDSFTHIECEVNEIPGQPSEPHTLIEKLKNLHLIKLNSTINETSKLMTMEELLEKHNSFVNEIQKFFEEEVQNQSNANIDEMNKSLQIELNANYEEVYRTLEERTALIEEWIKSSLKIFRQRFEELIKENKLKTKTDLEKQLKETERKVFTILDQKIGENDLLLKTQILPQLIKRVDTYCEKIKQCMVKLNTDLMVSFKDKVTESYKNQMETYILKKKFNSIQEFHNLLKESSFEKELFKRFDFNFNITDGFTDNYNKIRHEIQLKLNEVKEELHQDYNFRQEFEESFYNLIPEYDKKMQSLIESKIDNQMTDIFDFKVNESELTQFHIKSKDNIFEVMKTKHGMRADKVPKFTKHFQKQFEDHLSQIMDNYRNTIRIIEFYSNEWSTALKERVVIDINEKNKIIIQRRNHMFNVSHPFVKSYSKLLFEKIFPVIKTRLENKMCEIKQNYETIFTESVKYYEKGMRLSIQNRLDFSAPDIDLIVIHDSRSKETHSYFKDEIKKIDKSNGFTEDFILRLTKQLNAKKSKFQTALAQINLNSHNWREHLNAVRYLSGEEMINLNKQLMDKFISSGDEELDSIVKKQFIKHFDYFIAKVNQINESETTITEKIIVKVTELFEKRFDNKLISGFFTKIEVNAMFDKLLDYTLKSVKNRCDFNEYQNHLIEVCNKELDIKLRNYLTKAFAKHSQNSVNAKNLLKQTVDSSVELYVNEMKTKISSGTQRKDYQTINSQIKRKAIHYATEQIEQILQYFNIPFYQKLLNESHKQINEKIGLKSEKFLEFFEKNTPKETSIAIYFGRFDLHSIVYEEGVPNIPTKIDVTPNCIAIDNKIMVGTDALNHSEKLKYNNFDIKSLLGLSLPANLSLPFQMTNENKVKVRVDSKVYELSVESLIALQVLDIKTNTEKQTKSKVKSAVFTVPTHYNIKQRNAMKDVANIAGIESVQILTEITAAAIAFSSDTERVDRESESYVLFIAMNDNKCDSAICGISQKQIAYKSHFQYEFCDSEVAVIQNSRSEKTPKDRYKKVKKIFKILTEDFSHKTNSIKYLKNILIIGSSTLIPDLRFYIQRSEKFEKIGIFDCHPLNMIVRGSAIYGNPFYRNHFDITEATLYPISYMIKTNYSSTGYMFLTNENTSIPLNTDYVVPGPLNLSYYPAIIEFFQEIDGKRERVDMYKLSPQEEYSHRMFNQKLAVVPNYFHDIIIGVKDTGLPYIESAILPNNSQFSAEVDFNIIQIRIGLTLEDMFKEKEFIQTFCLGSTDKQFKQLTNSVPNETSVLSEKSVDPQLERSKQELESLYLKVKERIEKCDKLSPLLKQTFEQQLNETLAVIQSKESNRHKIDANKQFLDKIMQKTERFIN